MTTENIMKAVKSIKMKNAEGNDRIPQRILIDGISVLMAPLSYLFNRVYVSKTIPEQWKLAKITPVLNRLIKLDWLNLSLNAFKLKAKNIFLMN